MITGASLNCDIIVYPNKNYIYHGSVQSVVIGNSIVYYTPIIILIWMYILYFARVMPLHHDLAMFLGDIPLLTLSQD